MRPTVTVVTAPLEAVVVEVGIDAAVVEVKVVLVVELAPANLAI